MSSSSAGAASAAAPIVSPSESPGVAEHGDHAEQRRRIPDSTSTELGSDGSREVGGEEGEGPLHRSRARRRRREREGRRPAPHDPFSLLKVNGQRFENPILTVRSIFPENLERWMGVSNRTVIGGGGIWCLFYTFEERLGNFLEEGTKSLRQLPHSQRRGRRGATGGGELGGWVGLGASPSASTCEMAASLPNHIVSSISGARTGVAQAPAVRSRGASVSFPRSPSCRSLRRQFPGLSSTSSDRRFPKASLKVSESNARVRLSRSFFFFFFGLFSLAYGEET